MSTPAAPSRMVKVREVSTGRVFETWPVDARELVAHPDKEYEYAPADAVVGAASAAPAEPPAPLSAREQLAAMSYKELQELAKKVGVTASQKSADLQEALLAHVEGGALSLEAPQEVLGAPVVVTE